jgi:hypothetical protein
MSGRTTEPANIGEIDFRGSLVLGNAFRYLAWTLVGLGILGAVGVAADSDVEPGDRALLAAACVVGFAVTAAFTAFFGHVLKLLVAMYSQLWELQFIDSSSSD